MQTLAIQQRNMACKEHMKHKLRANNVTAMGLKVYIPMYLY
jgi:hypothetical protein